MCSLVYPNCGIDFVPLTSSKFSNVNIFNFVDNLSSDSTPWERFVNYYFREILEYMMNHLGWTFLSTDQEKTVYTKNEKKMVYWTCQPEFANELQYDLIYITKPIELNVKNKKIFATEKTAQKMDLEDYTKIPTVTGYNVYLDLVAKRFNWNANDWPQIKGKKSSFETNLDNEMESLCSQEAIEESFEYDMSGRLVFD